jgi:hypothetical protein
MSGVDPGIAAGVCAAVFGLGVMAWWFRRAWGHTPAGVMSALRAHDGERHVRVVWLEAMGGTWNPAKPLGFNNPLFAVGSGTYHLGSDGQVTLDWHPVKGEPAEYRGAVPDRFKDTPERRRVHKFLHLLLAVYAVAVASGFAIGYLLSTGTVTARLGVGMLGVFGGLVALWLVTLVFNVSHGIRGAVRGAKQAATATKRSSSV